MERPNMRIFFNVDSTGAVSDFQKGFFDHVVDWNKQFEMELYLAAIEFIKNDSTWRPGLILNTKVNTRDDISVDFKSSKYIISKHFAPWTGMGTPENPYQINNATKLRLLADNVNAGIEYEDIYFVITADLDLSDYKNRDGGAGWSPIGNVYFPFSGHMDGGGKKIKNLYINRPKRRHIGLFGYTDSGSSIKNICLENVSVSGDVNVGGLAGYSKSEITFCYSTGFVTGSNSVGGLVGYGESEITSCYTTGSVTGNNYVGGLVGYSNEAKISSCYSESHVIGHGSVGTLVGYDNKSKITDSHSSGHAPLIMRP